jgi:arylsulfatase
MPTVLEAAGVKAPETFEGVPQQPIDGISLAYSFTQPKAPSQRKTQIYELMENFGIYHDGWAAGTLPKRMAWEVGVGENRRTDVKAQDRNWSLFNLEKDFSTANDLSKSNPAKLKELQDMFWEEAARNNILPIHDWSQGREGRPTMGGNRRSFVYQPGLTRIHEDAAPHTIGHSFRIDADVTVPEGGANGVLITQGGRFGGYGFYVKEGRPVFHYNAVGTDQFTIRGDTAIAPGKRRISAAFDADTATPGTPGTMTLFIDGKQVASGRIGRTVAGWMSHTEGLDIGRDTVTPVNNDYSVDDSIFTGGIDKVTVTINAPDSTK